MAGCECAWTETYAKFLGLSEDVDRVLSRWQPPDKVRPGWRHVVTLLVDASVSCAAAPHRRAGWARWRVGRALLGYDKKYTIERWRSLTSTKRVAKRKKSW